jgi:hypothetical protein
MSVIAGAAPDPRPSASFAIERVKKPSSFAAPRRAAGVLTRSSARRASEKQASRSDQIVDISTPPDRAASRLNFCGARDSTRNGAAYVIHTTFRSPKHGTAQSTRPASHSRGLLG